MSKISLYTDGGARGNPGPAAIGVVAYSGTEQLWTIKRYIGETTNNQAEYQALIAGLTKAAGSSNELSCYLDSELVVKQLRGEYRVKDRGLQPLVRQVVTLLQKFSAVNFHHIAREKNKVADHLVNEALDEHLAKSSK
ncbi:MAG: ribonuclease HI family protein [Candidatus Komeilibacteria bacterium]